MSWKPSVYDKTNRLPQEFNLDSQKSHEDLGLHDFHMRLKKELPSLLNELEDKNSKAGPEYFVYTSQGKTIKIISFFTFFNDQQHIDPPGWSYALVAFNDENAVVGLRPNYILYDRSKPGQDLVSTGGIEVGPQNEGISTCIELAHMDVLQRIANIENKAITWKITDGNQALLERLYEKREKLINNADSVLERKIDKQSKQRERWEKLYGPQGILGLRNKERTFTPYEMYGPPLEECERIELVRKEVGEILYPVISKITCYSNPGANDLQKQNFANLLREYINRVK